MLIVKILVNKDEIDTVTALNISGDLKGVCTYKVESRQKGVTALVKHDRRRGAHELVKKMMDVVDNG